MSHSQRVNGLIAQILFPLYQDYWLYGRRREDLPLSDYELYILMAAGYLHDIGMQDLNLNGRPVDALTPKDHAEIRERHPLRSFEIIRDRTIEPRARRVIELGLAESDRDDSLMPIAIVAKAHGSRYFDEAVVELQKDIYRPGGRSVRADLLAALLMIGDEIDLHRSRANLPDDMVEFSPLSLLHHYKHAYIASVDVESGRASGDRRIMIGFLFPTEAKSRYAQAMQTWVLKKIEREVTRTQDILIRSTGGKLRWDERCAVLSTIHYDESREPLLPEVQEALRKEEEKPKKRPGGQRASSKAKEARGFGAMQQHSPYYHRGPVKDRRYFFGRISETRKILRFVAKRQSISIVGPRRIGKSSLLLHVADPSVKAEYGLSDSYAFVYIDWQGLTGELTEFDVYQSLLEEVIETAQRIGIQEVDAALGAEQKHPAKLTQMLTTRFNREELRTLCFNLGIDYDDLPAEGRVNKARELVKYLDRHNRILELVETVRQLRLNISWDNAPEVTQEVSPTFQSTPFGRLLQRNDVLVPRKPVTYRVFKQVIDRITRQSLVIVFLFDEFEYAAANHHLSKDFFTQLRGLGQWGKVVYVTASHEALSYLSYHNKDVLGSPFFNIFEPLHLGLMDADEARDLVEGLAAEAGLRGFFDREDLDFLQRTAGPHPFFLQVAADLLFEEKMKSPDSMALDYERIERQFIRNAKGHFEHAWRNLSSKEQRALKHINAQMLDDVTLESWELFEQECLVYQGNIFSSAFAKFVNRQRISPSDRM